MAAGNVRALTMTGICTGNAVAFNLKFAAAPGGGEPTFAETRTSSWIGRQAVFVLKAI